MLLFLLFLISECRGTSVPEIGLVGPGTSLENGTRFLHQDGNTMELFCDLQNSDWDFCRWFRPNSAGLDISCMMFESRDSCEQSNSLSTWRIRRDNIQCIISVQQTDALDSGAWTCMLIPSDPGAGNKSVERTVIRDVVEAEVELDHTDLFLNPEDVVNVNCLVDAKVRNLPVLEWRGIVSGQGNLSHTSSINSTSNIPHWTVNSLVTFTAQQNMDRNILECKVFLTDDFGMNFLAKRSITINVSPAAVVGSGLEPWKVATMVSVPLLLIILVLIIIFLCWWLGLLCFAKKEKEKDFIESEHREPIKVYREEDKQIRDVIDDRDLLPTISAKPSNQKGPKHRYEAPPSSSLSYLSSDPDFNLSELSQSTGLVFSLPWDPYSSEPDLPLQYRFEGSRTSVCSLSSLSSGEDESMDVSLGDHLKSLGAPFGRLARLYADASSEEDEDRGWSSSRRPDNFSTINQMKNINSVMRSWHLEAEQDRQRRRVHPPPESWV